MATNKVSKSHTSTRKKASKAAALSRPAKKAASKSVAKSKLSKKKSDKLARDKRRQELTLRAFRMAYEANQRGKFHRL